MQPSQYLNVLLWVAAAECKVPNVIEQSKLQEYDAIDKAIHPTSFLSTQYGHILYLEVLIK